MGNGNPASSVISTDLKYNTSGALVLSNHFLYNPGRPPNPHISPQQIYFLGDGCGIQAVEHIRNGATQKTLDEESPVAIGDDGSVRHG